MKDPFEEASVDVDRRGATFILVAVVLGLLALGIFNPGARDMLLIIAGIIAMVMLHECGHYFTAKRAGMKVTEFFLGFGPRLWSFRRGETEYGVKAILFGGYVRIIGMSNLEEIDPADEPRTFRNGSYPQRMIVILAGVTVNILLALLLFYVAIAGQGRMADGATTTVSHVVPHSAAAKAGLEKGDRIVAVDGTSIKGWEALKNAIEARGGDESTFTVVRDGEEVELIATPKTQDGQGFLGVGPALAFRSVGPLEAVPESFDLMGDVIVGTGDGIARVFSPSGVERIGHQVASAPTAGSSDCQSSARPRGLVGIVDCGAGIVNGNMWSLLFLLGSISLALAIFNLIPLLPFDGGHAVIVGYEWVASKITRRTVRVDYRKLMPVTALVLVIFLTIGLSVMFLDVRDAVGR